MSRQDQEFDFSLESQKALASAWMPRVHTMLKLCAISSCMLLALSFKASQTSWLFPWFAGLGAAAVALGFAFHRRTLADFITSNILDHTEMIGRKNDDEEVLAWQGLRSMALIDQWLALRLAVSILGAMIGEVVAITQGLPWFYFGTFPAGISVLIHLAWWNKKLSVQAREALWLLSKTMKKLKPR